MSLTLTLGKLESVCGSRPLYGYTKHEYLKKILWFFVSLFINSWGVACQNNTFEKQMPHRKIWQEQLRPDSPWRQLCSLSLTWGVWGRQSTNPSLVLPWSASTTSEKKRPFNSRRFSLFFWEATHRKQNQQQSLYLREAVRSRFAEGHELPGWSRCVCRKSWATLRRLPGVTWWPGENNLFLSLPW